MAIQERSDIAISTNGAAPATHPLDPLSAAEVTLATDLVREQKRPGERLGFVQVNLLEPEKSAVVSLATPPRKAWVVALDRADGRVYEGVVNLSARNVESWDHRPGVQPYPLFEEFEFAHSVIKADPGWQAAARARGVTDFDLVQIDPWPAGNFEFPDEAGRRILRGISYVKDVKASNGYARPLEGLVAMVDLVEGRVIRLVDERNAPLPAADFRYDAEGIPSVRTDLKPLEITQPEGVSFTIDGHLLQWQKWSMRVSLHPREGLVLHQIAYDDAGERRSICYRASMAEMVVPYGDTTAGQFWKNAFDSGEVGLGRLTNSLALGCDCVGEIRYMDGVTCHADGSPRVIENAICIHEEDNGILWKHTDNNNDDHVEVRRNRRLVVSSFATVGNYDYGFYWMFYQDGSWEQEVRATGIIQTQAVPDGDPLGTRHLVAKNLAGPIHQHFFCFRMDMDVDGSANTVLEVDTEPLPAGPANPYNNAFHAVERPVRSENEAARKANSPSARFWKVANPARKNAVGEPTAYAIFPGDTVDMMAGANSMVARRAGFARNTLWVTRNDPSERHPGGEYPAQSTGDDGLHTWVRANRNLEQDDVVLWYVVGMNHIVRPEDWPVAPVHRARFHLKPWGFFDHNPALDVAAPEEKCH
jgi:primary-amine oxidase